MSKASVAVTSVTTYLFSSQEGFPPQLACCFDCPSVCHHPVVPVGWQNSHASLGVAVAGADLAGTALHRDTKKIMK